MEAPNLNHLWAKLLVEELVRNGIRRFVIAPGSRSAPLAVQAFRNGAAETLVHFDERGAAFFALGSGLSGKPAAVICTSGTAVANCWPAVAEAFYSGIPLVVLSADRPPELQACGANQTMDQVNLFGAHVRAHLALPCPDAQIPPESILTGIDAVIAAGLGQDKGPVHINCMFREPLAPIPIAAPWPDFYMSRLNSWDTVHSPYTFWETPQTSLTPEQVTGLAEILSSTNKGLLVIGRLHTPNERDAVLTLANKLHWPVLADCTSGCRRMDCCKGLIAHYDLILRSTKFADCILPECVLHLGDVVISKHLQEFLRRVEGPYIQMVSRAGNRDSLHGVTRRYTADLALACSQLSERLEARPAGEYLKRFISASETVQSLCEKQLDNDDVLTELAVARIVDSALPADMALFLGNSMPVRYMDCFASSCHAAQTQANRGLSGIDGNIATAAGMGWGTPSGAASLIGDMAALHDMNSLALLKNAASPVLLILLNNRGGGIFSHLPIAGYTDVAGPCFVNPHSFHFEAAAQMFDIAYKRVHEKQDLLESLKSASNLRNSFILEVMIDHKLNLSIHHSFFAEVTLTLDTQFAEMAQAVSGRP